MQEAALNLMIARRIKESLLAAGHKVEWTRTEDRFVELKDRGAKALAVHADLFVSIHCNSGVPSAYGTEAFYCAGDTRSKDLARLVLSKLAKAYGNGIRLRGVKPDTSSHVGRLGVLRVTHEKMPAILIECGFLTSERDLKMLKDPEFGLLLGKAIAGAV